MTEKNLVKIWCSITIDAVLPNCKQRTKQGRACSVTEVFQSRCPFYEADICVGHAIKKKIEAILFYIVRLKSN